MNFFPTKLDLPLGHPLLLMEQLPEEVFEFFFFGNGYKKISTTNGNKIKRQLFTSTQYEHFLIESQLTVPTGFIFHPSRAGSTLICNMLSKLQNSRVIVEANVINKFARLKYVEKQNNLEGIGLKKIIAGYTVNQGDIDKVFFKFTSWLSNCSLEIIKSFEKTPWLYVYRNPLEVIVSNLLKPNFLHSLQFGGSMTGTYITGLSPSELAILSLEEFACITLAKNMQQILNNLPSSKGLIVEYTSIKEDFFTRILPHFKVDFTLKEEYHIIERSQYYSKSNSMVKFKSDINFKQKNVSLKLKQLARKYRLFDLYEALKKEETKQKRFLL